MDFNSFANRLTNAAANVTYKVSHEIDKRFSLSDKVEQVKSQVTNTLSFSTVEKDVEHICTHLMNHRSRVEPELTFFFKEHEEKRDYREGRHLERILENLQNTNDVVAPRLENHFFEVQALEKIAPQLTKMTSDVASQIEVSQRVEESTHRKTSESVQAKMNKLHQQQSKEDLTSVAST
eukprot:GFYU01019848.1.p1 GENE.GFYU01019848.1~~GFYU01019848.1.p1  ORF type:complete len:179 (+),score=11.34 GFYU01019848.1:163-699(+)